MSNNIPTVSPNTHKHTQMHNTIDVARKETETGLGDSSHGTSSTSPAAAFCISHRNEVSMGLKSQPAILLAAVSHKYGMKNLRDEHLPWLLLLLACPGDRTEAACRQSQQPMKQRSK